jgi:hypothetical protein
MQAGAALDQLAYLPGPPLNSNLGVASIFNSELFAYASGRAIAIIDVRTLLLLNPAHLVYLPAPDRFTTPLSI